MPSRDYLRLPAGNELTVFEVDLETPAFHQPAQAIRSQLKQVLDSKQFRSSELQRKFLTFVVLNTLEGRAAEIKEYSIGVDAFNRGSDFDPRVDSVVRVVARRVRERLAEYYSRDGQDYSVIIKLSPGSYVPSFSFQEAGNAQPRPSPLPSVSPSQDFRDEPIGPAAAPAVQSLPQSSSRCYVAIALMVGTAAAFLSYGSLFKSAVPRITKYTQLTRDGQDKVMPFSSGTPGEIVADSSRIYFSEITGTSVGLSQASLTGGETLPMPIDNNRPLVIKDIAPDASKLLVTDFYRARPDLPLQILPLPGGNPRPLGNLVGHDAAWSPRGDRLVYANGDALYIANELGTNSHELIQCPGFAFWPRWSPDSKVIRFTIQDRDGGTSLWEVSSKGSNLHRLINSHSGSHPRECCGSWSPDGRSYVFQSENNGATGLFVLHRSAVPIALTSGPLSFSAPVFSRDGKQIIAIATQRRGELVRYDETRKDFIPYLSGLSADHIEFSPDKKWIAYSSYPDSVVWRSRVDGGARLQLSQPGVTAWFPRWSPDGEHIVFVGSGPGKPLKLYLTPVNGGDPELLLPGAGSQMDPNWSPDGKTILFGAVPSSTGLGPGRTEIQMIDLRTRRVSVLPGSDGLSAPRWSPNGRYVVATALSGDKWRNPGVVVYDFATQKWSGLEADPIDNKAFSRDSRYFYFDKYVNNDPAIFRIRMADHKIERVAGLKELRRAQGVMGWWMGVTPDGSPMALRDASIEEIYALSFK